MSPNQAAATEMQDYVTWPPLTLLAAAHAACLAASIAILRSAPPAYPGWRMVGPSGTHWFCFIGAWVFGALISWVWLFVGSARVDAAFQMQVALVLAVVFTAAAAVCGFYIAALRRMALRWRGDAIRWRDGGRELQQTFSQFDAIRRGLDGAFAFASPTSQSSSLTSTRETPRSSWPGSPRRSATTSISATALTE